MVSMVSVRRRLTAGVAAMAMVAGAAGAAWAADGARSQSAAAVSVQTLAMAQRVAAYGIETGDPILLIAAARMARPFEVRTSDIVPLGDTAEAQGKPLPASSDEMLEVARELAGDRADLIGLIEDIEAESSRGSVYAAMLEGLAVDGAALGAGSYQGYIQPGAKAEFADAFVGGEPAVIALTGEATADIWFRVVDDEGNELCISDFAADQGCEWLPAKTMEVTIIIENGSNADGSNFTLWTN